MAQPSETYISKHWHQARCNKHGFTLLELIVALAVGALVLGAILSVFQLANSQNRNVYIQFQLAQNARIALERMLHDLDRSPSLLTTLPSSTEIILQDPDSADVRFVRYSVSGTELHRDVLLYTFPTAPAIGVPPYAQDMFDNNPTQTIVSTATIAEHIDSITWSGDNPITIDMIFVHGTEQYTTQSASPIENIR